MPDPHDTPHAISTDGKLETSSVRAFFSCVPSLPCPQSLIMVNPPEDEIPRLPPLLLECPDRRLSIFEMMNLRIHIDRTLCLSIVVAFSTL